MFATTALLVAGTLTAAADPTPDEKAFKDYMAWIVGGTWHATDAGGKAYEYRWEWVLDKSFVRLTGRDPGSTFEEIQGIDPATGKWTIWGFDSKGRVYQGTCESKKPNEWQYDLRGKGKAGPMSWKATETKVGEDKTRVVITEYVEDGKKAPGGTLEWTRKR